MRCAARAVLRFALCVPELLTGLSLSSQPIGFPVDFITAGVTTMTSIEIAELTGKEHGHVRRDITKMLDDLKKDPSIFGYIYQDVYQRDRKSTLNSSHLGISYAVFC